MCSSITETAVQKFVPTGYAKVTNIQNEWLGKQGCERGTDGLKRIMTYCNTKQHKIWK